MLHVRINKVEKAKYHALLAQASCSMCARIVSDIKCLACGSTLYIRYNTVAHIVLYL